MLMCYTGLGIIKTKWSEPFIVVQLKTFYSFKYHTNKYTRTDTYVDAETLFIIVLTVLWDFRLNWYCCSYRNHCEFLNSLFVWNIGPVRVRYCTPAWIRHPGRTTYDRTAQSGMKLFIHYQTSTVTPYVIFILHFLMRVITYPRCG